MKYTDDDRNYSSVRMRTTRIQDKDTISRIQESYNEDKDLNIDFDEFQMEDDYNSTQQLTISAANANGVDKIQHILGYLYPDIWDSRPSSALCGITIDEFSQ